MSFKAKIAAGAATFALVGGAVGMLGTLSASAKTPNCTGCKNWYTQKYRDRYILDDLYGASTPGNGIILFQNSNRDSAEDFVTNPLRTVHSIYESHHGLVSPRFDQVYGSDNAIEIQYEPNGVNSHLCVGTWPNAAARPGYKVRLEWCGRTSSTIWVIDSADANRMYTPLIAGSDRNFSNPLVLNYPAGHPTDNPRPWLNVQPLGSYSDHTVFDSQQWQNSVQVTS